MAGWYQKIARDIGVIPDAIRHYEDELVQAKSEIRIEAMLKKHQQICLVLLNKDLINYKK